MNHKVENVQIENSINRELLSLTNVIYMRENCSNSLIHSGTFIVLCVCMCVYVPAYTHMKIHANPSILMMNIDVNLFFNPIQLYYKLFLMMMTCSLHEYIQRYMRCRTDIIQTHSFCAYIYSLECDQPFNSCPYLSIDCHIIASYRYCGVLELYILIIMVVGILV